MSSEQTGTKHSAGNTRMEVEEYIHVDGQDIALDMHGYLINPDDWNKNVALKQAELVNIEMTEDHWFVVNYILEQYEYSSCVPEVRHTLKSMKEHFGKERATRKFLYQLFPYGYAIQACRIAGTRAALKTMLDL